MQYKDYYKIMGLSRDASQDEIKRAYRKLARNIIPMSVRKRMPRQSSRNSEKLMKCSRILKKRAAYDQLGAHWKAGQDFRPPTKLE